METQIVNYPDSRMTQIQAGPAQPGSGHEAEVLRMAWVEPTERTDLLRERAADVFGRLFATVIALKNDRGAIRHEGVELNPGELALYDPRVAAFRINVQNEWLPIYNLTDLQDARSRRSSYRHECLIDKPGQ